MKLLYDLALSLVGTPYLWGGKNPLTGLDCSGLVNVLLHAYGLDIEGNAQTLFNYYRLPDNYVSQMPQLGALVFYGDDIGRVHHVGMCLNAFRMIEAGGGGPNIVSKEIAAQRGAYVKITPIYERGEAGVFLPKYPEVL